MNRPARACFGLIFCGSLVAPAARGQDLPPVAPSPAPSIPTSPGAGGGGPPLNPDGTPAINGTGGLPMNIKNAANMAPFLGDIQRFVQQQVDVIAGDEAVAQKNARDHLINECLHGPSQNFLDAYASVINTVVMQVLSRPMLPALRVRLNLAIVVESVGYADRNNIITPVVLKLLSDPLEPVLVWGVRSARSIIAAGVVNGAVPVNVLTAIVDVVKAHPASGYLAEEAYHSIVAEGENVTPGANPNTLAPILSAFLDVLNFRVSLYQKEIPDNPAAESFTRFLSVNHDNLNPAQSQQVVQSLTDLVSVIGARATDAKPNQLESMCATLRFVAQAMLVFAPQPDNSPLGNMVHVVASTGGANVAQRARAVTADLHAHYNYLHAPPQVEPLTTQATTTASAP